MGNVGLLRSWFRIKIGVFWGQDGGVGNEVRWGKVEGVIFWCGVGVELIWVLRQNRSTFLM